ncbi:Pathogenesis-related protein 1C [Bienertia sinuspersici]
MAENLRNFSLVVTIATFALAQICNAQNSPQDYVDAHNVARATVGVGNLHWDDQVATYAQNYAQQLVGDCNIHHSGGPYGENIAGGEGATASFTGKDAVQMWVDEKANYDYNSNTCAQNKVCGHYTQVVWRDSIRLGCARAQCNRGPYFVICNYAPAGNIIGQKPY